MKVKITESQLRNYVSKAVKQLLREMEEPEEFDTETNDFEREPTEDDIRDIEMEYSDILNPQTIVGDNGIPPIVYETDLDCDGDLDEKLIEQLEDNFDAEIECGDVVTVTIPFSMDDKVYDFFQENQIEAKKIQ